MVHASRVDMRELWPWVFSAVTAAFFGVACGESKPDLEGNANNGTFVPVGGACGRDGDQASCGVELGRYDQTVWCAKGTRTCKGGAWSTCVAPQSAARYAVAAPAERSGDASSKGTIRGLTISSTPTDCTDNPCDPYCQQFPDRPDAAITGDSEVTIANKNLSIDEVPNGNPPDGFLKKGNDDANVCGGCAPGDTSLACQQACQFDSHCKGGGQNGCKSFADGESGSCTGIDVTSPLICQIPVGAPNNVGKRKIAICNRGTDPIPANSGVVCWKFPGGQPQYPNNDPVSGATNSAGPVDTFNEAVAPGECVTHIVDDAVFGNAGTTSVMCNVRQTVTSTSYVPSSGALPANGKAGSPWFTYGTWNNLANAGNVGGGEATINFTTTSVAGGAPTAGASSWLNTNNIGTTADGNSATVEVGSGRSTSKAPGNVAQITGTWANITNARVVDGSAESTTVSSVTTGALNATTGTVQAPATWNAGGTSIANVTGASNAVVASQVIPKTQIYSMWAGFSGASPATAAGTVITGATVTVRWKGATNKLKGHIEIWSNNGTTLVASSAVTAASNSLTDLTATFTQAQLEALAATSVTANKLVAFVIENSSNSADLQADVDSFTLDLTYAPPATVAKLRFTDFGLNIPAGSTISSVTVSPVVRTTGTGTVQFTVDTYKNNKATLVGTTSATRTNTTALAAINANVIGLGQADLSDANFAVDLKATSSSTTGVQVGVDGVVVSVVYTAPASQTVSLDGFNLAGLLPANAYVDSIKIEAGWGIDAANNRARFSVTPTLWGTALGTFTDNGPGTAITNFAGTWTPPAGTYYPASYFVNGDFKVDLTAFTTGAGFTGRVDWIKVTATYATPDPFAYVYFNNFNLGIPAAAYNVQLTYQVKWSSSDPNTQLCLYDITGGSHCTTPGATPTTLSTLTTGLLPTTPAIANSAWAGVYATHGRGSGASTVNVDYVVVQAQYVLTSAVGGAGVDECNINNNWTVSKKNPPLYCPSSTVYYDFYTTRVFNGTCPAGTRTRWRFFGWDATTPGTTHVDFRMRSFEPTIVNGVATCPAMSPAYADPPVTLAVARSTPTNTQVCNIFATPSAGCPADLTTYLGKPPAPVPNSDSQCLQMDAHGVADANGTPVLTSWNVAYDCLPSD